MISKEFADTKGNLWSLFADKINRTSGRKILISLSGKDTEGQLKKKCKAEVYVDIN